jgi:hypothetical protein
MPKLTYPLQTAPLDKIPEFAILTLDRNIRTTTRAIVGLPISASNQMLYAPQRLRGLGVKCIKWEAPLQHFNIAKKLSNLRDSLFHRIYDCQAEMAQCQKMLGEKNNPFVGDTARQLRAQLREKAFDQWAKQTWQGIGVKHFKTYPKGNRFMGNKSTLTDSQWVEALKLNMNYANLAGVPQHLTNANGQI